MIKELYHRICCTNMCRSSVLSTRYSLLSNTGGLFCRSLSTFTCLFGRVVCIFTGLFCRCLISFVGLLCQTKQPYCRSFAKICAAAVPYRRGTLFFLKSRGSLLWVSFHVYRSLLQGCFHIYRYSLCQTWYFILVRTQQLFYRDRVDKKFLLQASYVYIYIYVYICIYIYMYICIYIYIHSIGIICNKKTLLQASYISKYAYVYTYTYTYVYTYTSIQQGSSATRHLFCRHRAKQCGSFQGSFCQTELFYILQGSFAKQRFFVGFFCKAEPFDRALLQNIALSWGSFANTSSCIGLCCKTKFFHKALWQNTALA